MDPFLLLISLNFRDMNCFLFLILKNLKRYRIGGDHLKNKEILKVNHNLGLKESRVCSVVKMPHGICLCFYSY